MPAILAIFDVASHKPRALLNRLLLPIIYFVSCFLLSSYMEVAEKGAV